MTLSTAESTCSNQDYNACQSSTPPGAQGVFTYTGCVRNSPRLRTCMYSCNPYPCYLSCVQAGYYSGVCSDDITQNPKTTNLNIRSP
ncbi:unnamed protein product [Oppiella nova]|uniref:Uncharacterized protein n=1 Tax=Oppiella nova TaxID=334625 RepID=A0A7R9M5Y8_9ACAR|nr:unnamed protein product [Oppiella nova]CAG2170223.1 unnamed protein product [Oppiella nova]